MSGFAIARLTEERKNWRKDYPFGFTAKPAKKADNSVDMMRWEVGIPGREGILITYPLKRVDTLRT
jgi:ubiquitin-conjugating enzyme E2 I